MARNTINYKETSNLNIYLKIILGVVITFGIVFSVFIFLLSNSAMSKRSKMADISDELNSHYQFSGNVDDVMIYEGDITYFITFDTAYHYVFDQEFNLLKKLESSKIVSKEVIVKEYESTFDVLTLGYSKDSDSFIYEFKTVVNNSIGYYYFNAQTKEFMKFYIFGGNNNE